MTIHRQHLPLTPHDFAILESKIRERRADAGRAGLTTVVVLVVGAGLCVAAFRFGSYTGPALVGKTILIFAIAASLAVACLFAAGYLLSRNALRMTRAHVQGVVRRGTLEHIHINIDAAWSFCDSDGELILMRVNPGFFFLCSAYEVLSHYDPPTVSSEITLVSAPPLAIIFAVRPTPSAVPVPVDESLDHIAVPDLDQYFPHADDAVIRELRLDELPEQWREAVSSVL